MPSKPHDPDWFARPIRAAMGHLGWRQVDLAKAAGPNKETIGRALRNPPSDDPRAVETRRSMIQAFEAKGYRFPAAWREKALA